MAHMKNNVCPQGLLDEPPAHTMAEVGPSFKGPGGLSNKGKENGNYYNIGFRV